MFVALLEIRLLLVDQYTAIALSATNCFAKE